MKPTISTDSTSSSPRGGLIFGGCVLMAAGLTWILGEFSPLEPAAFRALFILLLAVLLWVTEVIPAFAVGILVIGLQIALLGQPNGVFAKTDRDWEQFVGVLGHPLIWLFFGGFVLAAGMARCGLDRWLAAKMLTRFGQRPSQVLLGVMLATFVLSMFMSNTATTAMMLAILSPLVVTLDPAEKFGKGLLVGTAVAANLGGMGSLIGTPPNAIAVGALAQMQPPQDISFLAWLILGLPPALVSLFGAWLVLVWLYPAADDQHISLPILQSQTEDDQFEISQLPRQRVPGVVVQRMIVAATLVITIGLWLTSHWHGVPTAAVAFVPIVLLTSTGVLQAEQIRGLNYDVLFLMAGGLALGQMVTNTNLAEWIVAHLPLDGISILSLAFVMAYVTTVLSNFMSNTAAANILVPLGITVASGSGSQAAVSVAVSIAFGATAAMCLPVATPPNAMVYASGRLAARDFLQIGLITGLLVPAAGILWLSLVQSTILSPG